MAGLYIHIPFCRSKCSYCDFFSTPSRRNVEAYTRALITEWQLRRHELQGEEVRTIYLGGGTPSLLPLPQLRELVEELDRHIPISSLDEFTIEANPEDITPDSIAAYRAIGINRISIGIQSFSDTELQSIGRSHSGAMAREALAHLQASGINYNADLIFGLPNQTLEEWKTNLDTLLSYRPPHFSSYLLSYEPGTRLYARLLKGEVEETPEELATAMYSHLCTQALRHGYHHYEISNLSLPGSEAIHNSAYWDYTPYLGLGVSAHSFDGTTRRYNPLGIAPYLKALEANTLPTLTDDETPVNRFNDYIITSLRTSTGFSPDLSRRLFPLDLTDRFLANAAPLLDSGSLVRCPSHPTLPLPSPHFAELFPNLRIPEHLWLTADSILRELILD